MERRKAIAAAAAASLTLLAGAAGIALNSSIVGNTGDDNVGQISPVNATAVPPVTVYLDDTAGATTATPAPAVQATNSQPVTTSAASGYQDDDRYEQEDDDDRYEHENEDEEHDEYEGAEDDD